jgi:hypothetical protein
LPAQGSLAEELSEHVIVVDRVVKADVAEFDVIGTEKFEDDAVGSINSKAPNFVVLRMQFLAVKGSRKRSVLVRTS